MRSPIDVVLERPKDGGVALVGSVPLGIVAPIRFQPHAGSLREQTFVYGGDNDARLLAWRCAERDLAQGVLGEERHFVTRLDTSEWIGLLDGAVKTSDIVLMDRTGVVVRSVRLPGGAARVEIAPATDGEELTSRDLPTQTVTDPRNGEEVPNPALHLRLPTGTRVREDADAEDFARLAAMRRTSPAAHVTTTDGGSVTAWQAFVVRETSEGEATVTRYSRQLDARVVVEHASLR